MTSVDCSWVACKYNKGNYPEKMGACVAKSVKLTPHEYDEEDDHIMDVEGSEFLKCATFRWFGEEELTMSRVDVYFEEATRNGKHRKDFRKEREQRWKELEQAAKYALEFIKVTEQELGEDDHGYTPKRLRKAVPYSAYDAMHRLARTLEYCYLYVDSSIFYDDDEEE